MAKSSHAYHHGDLRNALLASAGEVLEQDGIEAVTFRGLARRLAVSHAAPGHHFHDRTALLHALATEGFAWFADALEDAIARSATPEQLRVEAGLAYVRFALDHPQRFRLLFGYQLLRHECPEPLLAESDRAYGALLVIAGKSPQVDRSTYRMDVEELHTWALVHGAVTLWIDGALGAVEDEAELVDLVARMLDKTGVVGTR